MKLWQSILWILALTYVAGCASTLTGGTSRSVDERTTVTTGTTSLDTRTTRYRIDADGGVTVSTVATSATTKPTRTERVRTERATTQPSASSPRALPRLKTDGDGNTAVSFDVDKATAQLKARAYVVVPLTVAALAFLFFRQWLAAGLCFGGAVAAALVPVWLIVLVVVVAVGGAIGWLLLGHSTKDAQIRQLVAGADNLLGSFDAAGQKVAKGLMAQAHDESTKRAVRAAKK